MPILRTSRSQHKAGTLTLGNLLTALGETSFGWAIVVFSLLTLLPLPPGSSLITALPLLVTTGQMVLGYPHVKLPGRLARLRLDPVKLRRTVLRLRPVTRRLERVLTPRYLPLFARRNERVLGLLLLVIAVALFLPVPFSGWFPAISLFVFGVGLVEQDGLVATIGLILGGASVLVTATILVTLSAGAEAIF
ncbi:exopolysaccharide biosynthesis protein [Marivita sp.]|uniref:exopolysaccharide biosynthesis protein n=1 Tax=Marivita sp. TaxID=2003365 RepID=UPI0025C44E65|nr:exopolysaccharide biosynthesis protein [Marivita sp.]